MGIKLSELRRKAIYWEKDGVEVYNPNNPQKEEIIKTLTNFIDDQTKAVNMSMDNVIKYLFPILTNVEIEDENITEISEDPSEVLQEAVIAITEIITPILTRTIQNVASMLEMPNDVLAKTLGVAPAEVIKIKAAIAEQDINYKQLLEPKESESNE